jgi:hypothetical protein
MEQLKKEPNLDYNCLKRKSFNIIFIIAESPAELTFQHIFTPHLPVILKTQEQNAASQCLS